MPRMGYLFTDGLFDLAKVCISMDCHPSLCLQCLFFNLTQVANGEQKFIMRSRGSGEVTKTRENRGFREYKFSLSCGEEGWDKVELTKDMMEDLEINEEFRREVDTGKKVVIGRL